MPSTSKMSGYPKHLLTHDVSYNLQGLTWAASTAGPVLEEGLLNSTTFFSSRPGTLKQKIPTPHC